MAIKVSCPSCKKRFQVSEKFAGKKGPCPECKAEITIPELTEEVVIHEPQTFGPKGTSGQGVLKPIFREEERFPLMSGIVVGVSIIVAIALAVVHLTLAEPSVLVLGLMLVVLGPAVANGGYFLLRDPDLAAHEGSVLWIRTVAVGLGYAIAWGVYFWLKSLIFSDIEFQFYYLAFTLPPLVGVGGLIGWVGLELVDYLTGAMHYGIYLLASGVLLLIAGVTPF